MTITATCAFDQLPSSPSFYRGEQYDSDLGLYYLRARYYNLATGRFLSRDPMDGYIDLPATLHKYLYAGGDPVNGVDPTGRTTYTNPNQRTFGSALGEYLGVINNVVLRFFVMSQITVPMYLRSEQGKALQVLIVTGVSVVVAESCELVAARNELTELIEEVTTGGTYVKGPGMDCNAQPHGPDKGEGK